MQNDIISEIIDVEENATKLVDEARQKANRLISSAELESNKKLKEAVKQRRILNHQKIDEIRKKNRDEIKKYEESVKATSDIDTYQIKQISKELAKKICNSSVFEK